MMHSRVTVIVEAALSIALAYVLARFAVFKMPQGGTVSLEMLPLIVFAVRRGWLPGVIAGVAYGFLNYTLDPVPPVHWAQFALDYPVAHGLVGLSGLLSPVWRRLAGTGRLGAAVVTAALPGALAGVTARFAAHWVSGFVFFAQYAQGQSPWLYSLVYNGTYMLPAAIASAAAAALVLPSLERAVPSSRVPGP